MVLNGPVLINDKNDSDMLFFARRANDLEEI